ncbi:MAG TPA: outer membrane lipoprotein carrier protein LolA [Parafilimonas sp.]|nr:outer membrane lipoprotein carrier protein LolA [Parafilimonas sp.]
MKKTYLLFFLFVLISMSSFSQTSIDAQSVLDKVASKVKAAKGITASFTFSQYDKANHLLGSSKGIVKIKGSKYYVKQDKTEIISNGAQTWNYDGATEVMISKADNTDDGEFSPQQVLSGFNKNDFTYKLVSSAGSMYEILLTPIDKRKNFKQVVLYVNKSTNLISKAKIIDKTDSVTQITFSGISLNAIIPDSQFVFDASKHPGVEVVNQ